MDVVPLFPYREGYVVCCLCFEYTAIESLSQNEEGILQDVCLPCWNYELMQMGLL